MVFFDETYIYNKISCKTNIYCELLIIKQALSPYKNILIGFSNRQDPNEGLDATRTPDLHQPTSKAAYKSIIKKKFEAPYQERIWHRVLGIDEINFENVYKRKIIIKDKKLAEFNYKVLHFTLPCGVSLKKVGNL